MTLLPFDDRPGTIWLDGRLVPWRDARLHVLSHGLHYASCVFEGERVYDGTVFRLAEHSERLVESARIMGMTLPLSAVEIAAATRELVAANGLGDGYVRPIAWRGSEAMGVSAPAARPRVAIAAWPWPAYFSPEARRRGIRMTMAGYARPAPHTAPTRSKAAGLYMIGTLCKEAAERDGFDDALMLDWRGCVAEATGANVFLVIDGVLHTPTPEGFLDGITRRAVMALARARGLAVVERTIQPAELAQASELFLTGSAAEITPVGELDGRRFAVGPVSLQLIEDFADLTRGRRQVAA